MIYYRVALQESLSTTWRWKSSLLTSLETLLGLLKMYQRMPKERVRVFLASSAEQMDEMLNRANQGLLSTAIGVDQLWNAHSTSRTELRRLEIELGPGGDHDCPYTMSVPTSRAEVLAWTELLARRERGELEP